MLITTEVRWFHLGTIPDAIAQWFQQAELGQYLAPPMERQDTYLLVPRHEYLGLKLRQGNLEVKLRQAELGVQNFDSGWQGKVEQWVKWSGDSSCQSLAGGEQSLAQGTWINVQKVRSQRQYEVLPNRTCVAVPLGQSMPTGCTMELTQLTINNTAWWSLAFEATGDRQIESLNSVVDWVSSTHYPGTLTANCSYAYPRWLMASTDSAIANLPEGSKE
uniref:hypothetical protein n=1 Tax=Trichocoleus desertorum TaxID=1481672 RepID=UPI0025B5ADB3|nr:hypothetical protein [Trichocoleus desertorum]